MDNIKELVTLALQGDENAIRKILDLDETELEEIKKRNYEVYKEIENIRKEVQKVKEAMKILKDEYLYNDDVRERADMVMSARDFKEFLKIHLGLSIDVERIKTYAAADPELQTMYDSIKQAFEEDREKFPEKYREFLTASDSEIKEVDKILNELHELIYKWKYEARDEELPKVFEELVKKYNFAREILDRFNRPPEHVLMLREITAAYAYDEAEKIVNDYMDEYNAYRRKREEIMDTIKQLNTIMPANDVLHGWLYPETACKDNDEECKQHIEKLRKEYKEIFDRVYEELKYGDDYFMFSKALREEVKKELGADIEDIKRALE